MKIGYFADGPWSHLALERILADDRFEVAFIVPRYDTRDPVLAGFAERLGVDFVLLENVNSPDSIARLRQYGAELFVSMSYNQIFRQQAIDLPRHGVINCHAGALPFYRGRNILNWALINDAESFGVTVHYVNAGIDTGDIILQRHFAVTDGDDYASLLSRAISSCADLLVDSLDRVARGAVERTRQATIHPLGTYFGRRLPGDEWIDWNWPSRRIFNFVRAIAPPGPGARTFRASEVVEVLAAEEIAHAVTYIATPGEIVGRTERGAVVKTGDSTLLLTRLKLPGAEPLRIGTRLGLDPMATLVSMQHRIDELERAVRDLIRERPGSVGGGA